VRFPPGLFDELTDPLPCERCDGDGWVPGQKGDRIDCPRCAGCGEEPERKRKR